MLRMRTTWNVPARVDADLVDGIVGDGHAELVRNLPGVRRHVVLRFVSDAHGGNPSWYRGEELWVESAVAARRLWVDYRSSALWPLVSGPRADLWDVVDELDTTGEPVTRPDPGGAVTALTGMWEVPPGVSPAIVDDAYWTHHVPGVRKLPGLVRHTVLQALRFPRDRHPRFWGGAEVRFASCMAFERAYAGADWGAVRQDPFDAAVVGPDVDIATIEEEWVP